MKKTNNNGSQIGLKLSDESKNLVERAATLSGQSVVDFAVSTLIENACRIVRQHELTVLTDRDRDLFLAMLDAGATPNAALNRAAKQFKKRHGLADRATGTAS